MHADNIRYIPVRGARPDRIAGRPCALRVGGAEIVGTLRNVSAAGAFVEIDRSIDIDEVVTLLHPEAGQIRGRVVRIARDGAALAFTVGEQATTFALAAMCSDMTVRTGGDASACAADG